MRFLLVFGYHTWLYGGSLDLGRWYLSELLRRGLGVADGSGRGWLLWTLRLGITVAAAYVFYPVIERPCLHWARSVPSSTVPAMAQESMPTDGRLPRSDRRRPHP